MKNWVAKSVFFLSCVTVSASSLAQGPGWITAAKVVKIVAVVNGGINIRITPELTGCTSQSGYGPNYASVTPDHPGLANIHAILLSAYMADKTVALYLQDDTCKVTEVIMGGM